MAVMRESAGRVLMLVENVFPEDTRVKNEAFTLMQAGYHVTVISLRKKHQRSFEVINGVRVYRARKIKLFGKNSPRDSFAGKLLNRITSIVGYACEYFYFILVAFFMSLYVVLKQGFDVVHVHTPPNTLFLVGLFYRLMGKKFVFDHHDLSPELYQSRFGRPRDLIYHALLAEEKLGLRCANLVIATNESYKRIEVQRGNLKSEKIFIVRNGPDLHRIKLGAPDEKLKAMGKTILGYVGDINPQDGVDYLLRSLRYLAYDLRRKGFYCVIIGSGDALDDLKILARELKIEDNVWFTGYISDEDLLRYLSTADICVDPDPSSPLNDASTWIKIMEYMALKKPIVSFDLPETRFSAQQAALYVPPNDEKQFAEAIARLMDDPAERARRGEWGYKRVVDHLAWHHVSKNLLFAYETLMPQRSPRVAAPLARADEKMRAGVIVPAIDMKAPVEEAL
jgi:glycosyltransferase involved in cell wall biosynthesis